MRSTSYSFAVLVCFILKNVSCVIWENLLLDTLQNTKFKNINQTEKYLNVTEMAQSYGCQMEEFEVATADGYLLAVQHIVRCGGSAAGGAPVLVMAGFINSAGDWLTRGPGDCLPLTLVKEGYDVWLGNARASKYSYGHRTLSPKQEQYWNFSFHEIGIYDLPAMIDFIRQKTGSRQLTYVGHSQGTTAFFIMASLRRDYNEKVNLMVALAPIAWTRHVRSPVARVVVPFRDIIISILRAIGAYDFMPSNAFNQFIFRDVCSSTKLAELACESLLFTLYGFDYGQVPEKWGAVEVAHFPSGSSIKQLYHYMQLIHEGRFCQFDHGVAGNLREYGCSAPPDYPVGEITTPVALMYGLNDWLSDVQDIAIFQKNCRSVVEVYAVPHPRFNHMDFLWSKDVNKLVYKKIVQLMKSRNSI